MITNPTTFWAFIALVLTLAVAGVTLLGALAVTFFARNRPVRVARHESIPAYYGRLALAH